MLIHMIYEFIQNNNSYHDFKDTNSHIDFNVA
jgi:hypothetical protein